MGLLAIKCPKCSTEIQLNEALTAEIEATVQSKYQAQAKERELELLSREDAIEKQTKELQNKQDNIETIILKKLAVEKELLFSKAFKKAQDEMSVKTHTLEEEIEEKTNKLQVLQKQEAEFRRKQREMEFKQQELELESQRKLDEECKKIMEKAKERAAEENQLKIREKDELIKGMQTQIEVLKRKAETGSQERQGEALELQLFETLQHAFPYDVIEEIKKGTQGADILQKVHNSAGKECGIILWESKNTKAFSKLWLEKLKADQQAAKADIAVIISATLPKDICTFGKCDDIWVSDFKSCVGLAIAFRESLIRIDRERAVTEHQHDIKDVVYQYVTGNEFSMRMKRVVDAYLIMQKDLESEKVAVNKLWSKRSVQIYNVLENLSGMRGEIEGIVGGQKTLPALSTLSLETLSENIS